MIALCLGIWLLILQADGATPPWRTDRVLVQPRAGSAPGALDDFHRSRHSRVLHQYPRLGGIQVIELPAGLSVQEAILSYRASALVDCIEPDYWIHTCVVPDDPLFTDGTQWHLNNTGQSGGRANADIDAPEAWDTLHDAPNVIVAVVDSGIRLTHEDLAANLWTNLGEIAGNRVDDDRDGYIDDVHGINAITGSGDPTDDVGHGTHVAGILGAVGNNGLGGVGVAWKVQIMACKFIDSSGSGATSDAIRCLDYARIHKAGVVNCSWGSSAGSTLLLGALQRLRDSGIVVAIAAGNDGRDNDVTHDYPASYNLDNIVSVLATTATDTLASFSNYGRSSTDIGAPGVGIRSTWNTSDQSYSTQSGTSMATPVVSGMLALLRARFPLETPAQLIERLNASADSLSSLQGKCVSGGRANLQRAISQDLIVGYSASTWQGSPPLIVQFTNTTRGTIRSQHWDFGDGTTSTAAAPSHTFASEGTFSVRLDVTGGNGQTGSKSQTVSVVGNYTIAAAAYSWIDPAGMTLLTLGDNSVSTAQSLPFPFPFYGQTYNSIRVGANGVLGFAPDGLGATANSNLPSPALPNGVICPYWDNLNPAAGGGVRVGVTGTAPARRWVASWVDVPRNSGGGKLTFQAILEEDTGRIRFQYLQVQPGSSLGGGRRATVGVENQTGLTAARYLVDGSPLSLTNQKAITFQPKFMAGLQITPSERVSASGPVGGPYSPASASYAITNAGTRALKWHATHNAGWLDVTPVSGSLEPGSEIHVTATVNPTASSLAAGSYLDAIEFVNELNGLGNTTREFSLTANGGAGILTVTPDTGLDSSGPVGGPFTPSSTIYTIANTGGATISWSANVQTDWSDLSSHGGTLGPGETTSLRVGFGSSAYDLGAGTYDDAIAFSNLTNGRGGSFRSLRLAVGLPTPASLTAAIALSGGINLQLTGQPGATYVVEQSPDLLSWTVVATQVLPSEGVLQIPAISALDRNAFFRARSGP